jgi:alkenylglycerophosphocholine hydrolase
VCSAAFAGTLIGGPFPGHWLVKALSIAALAWLVRPAPWLVAGLLFGSLGDALLSLRAGLFVYGLAAFLCGHVAYIAGFQRASSRSTPAWPWLGWAAYGAAFYLWLYPSLGALRFPVAAYMVAIISMVAASHGLSGRVTVGAVLFLASDSVLAANRFHAPVPLGGYIVWGTYYLGQLLIATGCARILRSPATSRKAGAAGA